MTGDFFNILAGSMSAWNQIGLFCGGLLMFAIGGAMLADFIWWRVTADHFTGKINGVLWDGKHYFPMVEYTNHAGAIIQADTESGSSILTTKFPGRQVKVLVKPKDPETARIKGYVWFVIGLILALPGLALCGIAVTQYDFSIYTILIGLGVIGYGGLKLSKIIKPKNKREKLDKFRNRKRKERQKKREKMKSLSEQEIKERLAKHDKTNIKIMPVMLLIGLALLCGGIYLGNEQYKMEQVGVSAEGSVIRFERVTNHSSEGNSFTYYPVVRFEDEQGNAVTFKSRVGSSHPTNEQGDIVSVIYNPQNPEKAMIDSGWWNWFPTIGCASASLLFLWINIQTYIGTRRRAKGDYF
ncbi:MAG: DUF3592 domain-containing protein [Nitrospinales bacterium]